MKDIHIKLRRIQDDFVDFSFVDVQEKLLLDDVLTKEECQEILSEVTEIDQTDRLFFILIYKSKDLDKFSKAIALDYPWLCEKLKIDVAYNERNDQLILKYKNAIKQSDIPKNQDRNIHRCKYLWEIQSHLKNLKREQFLCIHGKVGYGKRWLVKDACVDFNVVKRMGFKIFWVNVNKCTTPDLILEKLDRLKIILHGSGDVDEKFNNCGSANTQNEIVNIKRHLRNILESENYKNCLLILSDVQNRETMKAFDLHCKILMITKYVEIIDEILTESKYVVNVSSGFTVDESFQLLSNALNTTPRILPPEAHEVHEKCKGYPFIIHLVAKKFAEFIQESDVRRLKRWRDWVLELNEHKVELDTSRIIDQTTKLLSNDYQNYYKSLVIFTDNVSIPIKVLQQYWGVTLTKCEEIVKKFEKYSLLEIYYIEADVMVCSLHYLYYVFLKEKVDSNDRREMHANFIDKYNIPYILSNRKEYELLNFPDDLYIYFNIGYHLKAAERTEIFPLLYTDISFLEQKLRITGLPNTIGDLKTYRDEILGPQFDDRKVSLIDEILEFLPGVEEFLYKSKDTTLLQYALTSSEVLKETAFTQAKKYADRLWMDDIDHTQRQRQIVKIPQEPTLVKFLNNIASLVGLVDCRILLQDLSSEFEVENTYYSGHTGTIKCIELFRQEYFVSLATDGIIKLWSLKHTPVDRRVSGVYENSSDLSSPRQNNQNQLSVPHTSHGKCVQTLAENQQDRKYVAFCIDERSLADIMCATRCGRIYFYKWVSTVFMKQPEMEFKTKISYVHSILFIPTHFLLVLTESGTIAFFNLTTSGQIPCTKQWVAHPNPLRLHLVEQNNSIEEEEEDNNGQVVKIILVFQAKLVEMSISISGHIIFTDFDEIYSVNDGNRVTSSALSDDADYIILGTEQGISVLDRKKKVEVLRSSVSDHIQSVDICAHNKDPYNYMLISSSVRGGKSINLHGLMVSNQKSRTMSWRRGSPTSMESYTSEEELNSWLKGGKMFTIKEDNDLRMVVHAVDSEGKIHYRSSKNQFSKERSYKIKFTPTSICNSNLYCYVGCMNGYVYKLGAMTPILQMSQSVDYINFLKPNVMIVGTAENYKLFCFADDDVSGVALSTYPGQIFSSYNVCNNYICVIKSDCSVTIFDDLVRLCFSNPPKLLYGCVCTAYHDGLLVIGTKRSGLLVYRFEIVGEDLKILSENVVLSTNDNFVSLDSNTMTSLCISADKTILAVGYENGWIDLHSLDKLVLLKTDLIHPNGIPPKTTHKINKLDIIDQLLSHTSPIYDLKFSPGADPNAPTILVSISAEIIFWNVSIVLNNLFDNRKRTSQQRSARFSRSDLTYNNRTFSNGNGNSNGNSRKNSQLTNNSWQEKVGAPEKRELLACIKFVGNKAERLFTNTEFSKFVTIDNEGNIYFLRLIDFTHYSNMVIVPIDT